MYVMDFTIRDDIFDYFSDIIIYLYKYNDSMFTVLERCVIKFWVKQVFINIYYYNSIIINVIFSGKILLNYCITKSNINDLKSIIKKHNTKYTCIL